MLTLLLMAGTLGQVIVEARTGPSFWLAPMIQATLAVGGVNGIVIPVDIQWWQGIVAMIGVLGLSPAPWILGLALNKIEFVGPAHARHQAAIAEQARHYEALLVVQAARYADLVETNKANAAAADAARERANQVTDAALSMTEVVRANTHVIESLNEIAREATGT